MSRTKYVGMDVHQATAVVAVINDQGKLVGRSVIETTADALHDFVWGYAGRSAWRWRKVPRPPGSTTSPPAVEHVVENRPVVPGADAEEQLQRTHRTGLAPAQFESDRFDGLARQV